MSKANRKLDELLDDARVWKAKPEPCNDCGAKAPKLQLVATPDLICGACQESIRDKFPGKPTAIIMGPSGIRHVY